MSDINQTVEEGKIMILLTAEANALTRFWQSNTEIPSALLSNFTDNPIFSLIQEFKNAGFVISDEIVQLQQNRLPERHVSFIARDNRTNKNITFLSIVLNIGTSIHETKKGKVVAPYYFGTYKYIWFFYTTGEAENSGRLYQMNQYTHDSIRSTILKHISGGIISPINPPVEEPKKKLTAWQEFWHAILG